MFTVAELLSASGGRLFRGRGEARVGNLAIDSRSIDRGQVFLAIKGERFDGHDFLRQAADKGAACLIVASSCVKRLPYGPAVIKVNDTLKALAGIAAFHRERFDIPLVAVTGSNGKTTTKEMIAEVLGAEYRVLKNEGTKNNHIGMPLALLGLDSSYQAAVLELGSNHPGEIAYLAAICRPTLAVITNVGASHLEHFRDLRGVLKEKTSLLRFLRDPAIAVLNADDPLLARSLRKQRVFSYGVGANADFTASLIKQSREGVGFLFAGGRRCVLKTFGAHNVHNALAAAAVGRILGLSYDQICRRLNGFSFPRGRMRFFEKDAVMFIDDTYNSNPLSLNRALNALRLLPAKGRKVLVMGDMLELGVNAGKFHKIAGKQAAGACDILIAVGALSRQSAEAAERSGLAKEKVFFCSDAPQARAILYEKVKVRSKDVVLVKGSRGMRMEIIFDKEIA